jgi:hypothetical protein
MNPSTPSNPTALADLGEKIYNEDYRKDYETLHTGKFVVVNIRTRAATLGDTPEQALQNAKQHDPSGLFHLIKVGSAGAFRVSYASHAVSDWLSQ